MGTTKGYTGQYNDSLTQLDYYGARYYDPLVGVFLSADSVQGNLAGTDPYSYVGENPETYTDPSGEMYAPPAGAGSLPLPPLPPWQLPGGSQSTQSTQNSNVQPDTCTQMAQAGHPCNVQAAAQGPGQVGEYQRPGLLSMGCVVLLGPCVLLTTSSPERSGPSQGWAYPTFPVNICVPYCTKGDEVGEGTEGASNGKESDLTKLLDSMLGDLLAADDGGEGQAPDLGWGNIGNAGGDTPPNGWEKLDYGSDNKPGISDFTHVDEAGNRLEATLYHDSGELQISWMDSLAQARNYLPDLINWLGDSVQVVKGYVSDNLATYFSPESRGVTLVNRMFSSVLEGSGFAPGTIESEGNRMWIIFRRLP